MLKTILVELDKEAAHAVFVEESQAAEVVFAWTHRRRIQGAFNAGTAQVFEYRGRNHADRLRMSRKRRVSLGRTGRAAR